MRNPCLDAALAELEAVGIRDYQLVRGGKHLQLRWAFAGHSMRILTVPLTPSDWRSPRNTRSDIRKLLRLDGLLEMPQSNRALQKPTAKCWRQQLEALARRLSQLSVPDQFAAERREIAAAMRKLVNRYDLTEGGRHENNKTRDG
jgi:hypothetical protein